MHMQIVYPRLELHSIENCFENTPHLHPEHYQITVPIQGTCYFSHENREVPLLAGEGLLLRPQDKHSFYIGSQDRVIIFKINDHSFFPSGMEGGPEPAQQQRFNVPELSLFLQRWSASFFMSSNADCLAHEEQELQLLDYVRGMIWKENRAMLHEPIPRALSHQSNSGFMQRAIEYIHDHYCDSISIDDLAAIALQSRHHFIRSFKAFTGATPYQYVLRLRIAEAKRQLKHSKSSVTDISYKLGFSSPSQFYRLFIKATGVTPESYRQQSR